MPDDPQEGTMKYWLEGGDSKKIDPKYGTIDPKTNTLIGINGYTIVWYQQDGILNIKKVGSDKFIDMLMDGLKSGGALVFKGTDFDEKSVNLKISITIR